MTLSHRGWPGDKGVGQETGVSCITRSLHPPTITGCVGWPAGKRRPDIWGTRLGWRCRDTPNGRLPAGQARPDAVQLVLPDRGACSTGVRAPGMEVIGGRTSPKDIQQRLCWARAGVGH